MLAGVGFDFDGVGLGVKVDDMAGFVLLNLVDIVHQFLVGLFINHYLVLLSLALGRNSQTLPTAHLGKLTNYALFGRKPQGRAVFGGHNQLLIHFLALQQRRLGRLEGLNERGLRVVQRVVEHLGRHVD